MPSVLTFLYPTPPNEFKRLSSSSISCLLIVLPVCISVILSYSFHYTATLSNVSLHFSVADNSTPSPFLSAPQGLSRNFFYVGAVTALPFRSPHDLILVSDFPSNTLYTVNVRTPSISNVFLSDAGRSGNETLAASLLRPGIGAIATISSSPLSKDNIEEVDLLVGENSARSLSVLTIRACTNPTKSHTPEIVARNLVVSSFNNSRINSPNGIHVDKNGNIFFIDGYFGLVESADPFNRKIDDPPNHALKQNVYYILAAEIHQAKRGVPVEPHLLLENVDRPTGIAVSKSGDRLFLMLGSPRKPHLLEYSLEVENDETWVADDRDDREQSGKFIAHSPVIIYDWSKSLHDWEQKGFSSVAGNVVVDQKNRLYVGVGDGVSVFDVSMRRETDEPQKSLAWLSANVPPGPAQLSIYREKWLYIAISDTLARVELN